MGGSNSANPSLEELDQQKLGVPHIENQYWKMARDGMVRSLSSAFQDSLIDCRQVVVATSGHTLLHESVILDRREVFKLCEIYGADWDHKDLNGVTTLMKAAALNRTFYLDRLIELGAEIEIKDNNGRTALDYAMMYENYEAVDSLTLEQ